MKVLNNSPSRAKLEHSEEVLVNVHDQGKCKGEYCTIHDMSDHHMRSFPQHWRGDRYMMERICPHGVGHPDPDDPTDDTVHGCDGCCIKIEGETEVERLRFSIQRALNELGVPGEGYAAPVANAHQILKDALQWS